MERTVFLGEARLGACRGNRVLLEEEAHGEKVAQACHPCERVFVRLALEAGEHAREARQRESGAQQHLFAGLLVNGQAVEHAADDVDRANPAGTYCAQRGVGTWRRAGLGCTSCP